MFKFFSRWFSDPSPLPLSVAQLGDPILRQPAQAIDDPTADWVQVLADQMIQHIEVSKAVGLAAPQVSQLYALMVIASHPNDRYPNAPEMEPLVLMNPKIVAESETVVKDWEGCLSIPQLRGQVKRHQWIEVAYCDRSGQAQHIRFEDFVARIFQHEYDHLIGKFFLDHLEEVDDLMTEKEWRDRILGGSPDDPSPK
ncbi:MAG: peptide deformylase [Prochlorotrichaceae cyanobacterium]|jgi:peptide deformylase